MTDESTDRRSPEPDAALEAAFVAGTLPEADRRTLPFVIGDVVTADDNIPRTVTAVFPDDGTVECSWFVADHLVADVFSCDALHTTGERVPVAAIIPGEVNIVELIASGHYVAMIGSEWNVTTPSGTHGFGQSIAEAVANLGAVIVPDADGRRILTRTDGTAIELDAAGKPVEAK